MHLLNSCKGYRGKLKHSLAQFSEFNNLLFLFYFLMLELYLNYKDNDIGLELYFLIRKFANLFLFFILITYKCLDDPGFDEVNFTSFIVDNCLS